MTDQTDQQDDQFDDLPDGAGCTDIWEYMSERRDDADENADEE